MSLPDPIDRDDLAALRDLLNDAAPTTQAEALIQIREIKIVLRRLLRAILSGRFG